MTERAQAIENSIITAYEEKLWKPFVKAVETYRLVEPGDRIAVCISGGKDSMLMAKLFQELERRQTIPFEAVYLVMNPGYNPINRETIEKNSALMEIPIRIFDSDVFEVANAQDRNPCYLCARMRRGFLYARAQELGCNKIALGHHFDDVIETTLMGMLWGAQMQAMPPMLHAKNFENMALIRPLYMVREEDIIQWSKDNGLAFIQCACRFTENSKDEEQHLSKRKETKKLIRELRKEHPEIEENLFRGIHALQLDTFPGWKTGGEEHSFLENLR